MLIKVLAIAAMLAGVLGAACMIVMLMLGAANSSPREIRQIKLCIFSTLAVAVMGVAGGTWALVTGRTQLAIGLGIAPMAFSIILAIVLFVVWSD